MPCLSLLFKRGVSKIELATPLLERFAWFTTRNYSNSPRAVPYGNVALFDGQHEGINAVGRAYHDV
jgi:hypothetical protein